MWAPLLLAAGCSLVFAPDRDMIDLPDAGLDASPLPDGGDGGTDGGADGGDACMPRIEQCSGGADDDCDGFIDCDDPECAASVSCCELGPSSGTEWDVDGYDRASWTADGITPPTVTATTVEFGLSPGSLVLRDCAPLVSGMRRAPSIASFSKLTTCPM